MAEKFVKGQEVYVVERGRGTYQTINSVGKKWIVVGRHNLKFDADTLRGEFGESIWHSKEDYEDFLFCHKMQSELKERLSRANLTRQQIEDINKILNQTVV